MGFQKHFMGQFVGVPDSVLTVKFELLLVIIEAVYALL